MKISLQTGGETARQRRTIFVRLLAARRRGIQLLQTTTSPHDKRQNYQQDNDTCDAAHCNARNQFVRVAGYVSPTRKNTACGR